MGKGGEISKNEVEEEGKKVEIWEMGNIGSKRESSCG